jgi:hypothetical protein
MRQPDGIATRPHGERDIAHEPKHATIINRQREKGVGRKKGEKNRIHTEPRLMDSLFDSHDSQHNSSHPFSIKNSRSVLFFMFVLNPPAPFDKGV